MNKKIIKRNESLILYSVIICFSVYLIFISPADSFIWRSFILTVLSMSLMIFKSRDSEGITEILFQFLIILLIIINKSKTSIDIVKGKSVLSLVEFPDSAKNTVSIVLSVILVFILVLHVLVYLEFKEDYSQRKNYSIDTKTKKISLHPYFLLILLCLYVAFTTANILIRPLCDVVSGNTVNYSIFQEYLYLSFFEEIISLLPVIFLFKSLEKDLSADTFLKHDFSNQMAEVRNQEILSQATGCEKKITHRMIERLLYIHSKIKSGSYPNTRQLANNLEASVPTINRDIEYLRDSRGAPIEYDHQKRGYYYTEEYELFFEK